MAMIFFATDEDLADVWNWLFQVPGMKVFEEYSAPDQRNRWFKGPDELAELLRGRGQNIAAWPSDVGGRPEPMEVVFSKSLQDELNARGRTVLVSPALITVRRTTSGPECLNPFSISCWTEKGARQRSVYDEQALGSVNWPRLRSIVASIERRIRKHSLGKLHSHPIMPTAYKRLVAGDLELWNWGEKVGYPSSHVTPANVR